MDARHRRSQPRLQLPLLAHGAACACGHVGVVLGCWAAHASQGRGWCGSGEQGAASLLGGAVGRPVGLLQALPRLPDSKNRPGLAAPGPQACPLRSRRHEPPCTHRPCLLGVTGRPVCAPNTARSPCRCCCCCCRHALYAAIAAYPSLFMTTSVNSSAVTAPLEERSRLWNSASTALALAPPWRGGEGTKQAEGEGKGLAFGKSVGD